MQGGLRNDRAACVPRLRQLLIGRAVSNDFGAAWLGLERRRDSRLQNRGTGMRARVASKIPRSSALSIRDPTSLARA